MSAPRSFTFMVKPAMAKKLMNFKLKHGMTMRGLFLRALLNTYPELEDAVKKEMGLS